MTDSHKRTSADSTKTRKKRFYGWNIVLASALTNGFGGSVHWQGFTVFFIPISQSLGLTAAQTAMPFALSRAENGLTGPITGWLIDRYGVRKIDVNWYDHDRSRLRLALSDQHFSRVPSGLLICNISGLLDQLHAGFHNCNKHMVLT